MKPIEFNVLRMILLMTANYSFCEAFEKEGFTGDISELQGAYNVGNGKINHKAELVLRKIYKEHIVNGSEEDINEYNNIILPPEIKFISRLVIARILESSLPKGVAEILEGREDYVATEDNDKLYGTEALEDAIIECDVITFNRSKEVLAFLEALNLKMSIEGVSYIQIIK